MLTQKQKFLFYIPSLIFLIWLYFFLANIIKSTLRYEPHKEASLNNVNFSYKIESSNNARAKQGEEKRSPFVRDLPKVGRNDPCPCGSGKKFKQCCGKIG